MAQITLNTKLTSEQFTLNDTDILYMVPLIVNGSPAGSTLTIIDTASVDTQIIDVEESNAAIVALTDNLVQVTLEDRSTPYIAISRIKDIVTVGSYAQIRYDGNGNVFQTLKTTMTLAQVLAAINTEENVPKEYLAVISQSGTNAPTEDVVFINQLTNTLTYYYDNQGIFRIGCDDFGNYADNKVWVMLGTSNQNSAAKTVDAYTTSAPIERDPDQLKCEIALEAVNNTSFTNGLLYQTAIRILVFP